MQITATLIAYHQTCQRKLWLHAKEIRMEHTSDLVAEGKLIGETAYERRSDKWTQVEFEGVKIDFYDARARVVHETKRGKAAEQAHRAQVKYYLYKLRQHGIPDASGIIEYPDLRKSETIAPLTEADVAEIEKWEMETAEIIAREHCPVAVRKPICKNCSFFDLCFVGDE